MLGIDAIVISPELYSTGNRNTGAILKYSLFVFEEYIFSTSVGYPI